MEVILLPLDVVKFYYGDVVAKFLQTIGHHVNYLLHFFSVPLLLRTFFKPLKSEYRSGFVGFSIIAGIIVKTFLITVASCFIALVFCIEALLFVVYLLFPFFVVYLFISTL